MIRIWPGGRASQASIADMCSSCTSASERIHPRSTLKPAPSSNNGRRPPTRMPRRVRPPREGGRSRGRADQINPVALLDRLTQVEAFERFLHRTFPGKTRFSIEGLDMLVPILDEVIGEAGEAGIGSILIGMAHRGRLNVMAHVLCKPYEQILAEFKDPVSSRNFREDMAWTGDVKYHAGAQRAIKDGRAMNLEISMPPNPSHLEAVDPLVVGIARAAGTTTDAGGAPEFDPSRSLPILIHADAAFPGQGVV